MSDELRRVEQATVENLVQDAIALGQSHPELETGYILDKYREGCAKHGAPVLWDAPLLSICERPASPAPEPPSAEQSVEHHGAAEDLREAAAMRVISPHMAAIPEGYVSLGWWEQDVRTKMLAGAERIDALLAERDALAADAKRLAERVQYLDRVIGEHHSASIMREEHDVCPVCMDHGGVDFFATTERLVRAAMQRAERGTEGEPR